MKIKVLKKIVGLTLFTLAIYSCTYDKQNEYYIEINCDTLDVTFSGNVEPILESSCLSCHDGPSGNAGVDLSTHSKVKLYAQSGLLMGVIRHEQGYSPMPKNQSKLDHCSIRQLEIWIENGTLNN